MKDPLLLKKPTKNKNNIFFGLVDISILHLQTQCESSSAGRAQPCQG